VVSLIGPRAPQLSHKQPILPLDRHVEFSICQPIRLALTRNLYLAGAAAMLGAAVAWFAACVRSVLYGWWHQALVGRTPAYRRERRSRPPPRGT
jgi:hypothetical protein